MAKKERDIINATPSKRLYRSIIADYGLNTAVSELVDNVLDSRARRKFKRRVNISIDIDMDSQTIEITDDAGGVKEIDLSKLVSPGSSHSDGEIASIGIFGVGSKRAAVALARDIKIITRYANEDKTFQVEYDDVWLADEDWSLPYFEVDSAKENTTRIALSRLRFPVAIDEIKSLRENLSKTYAVFLQRGDARIVLNEVEIAPQFFDQWSFSPDGPPSSHLKKFTPPGHTLPVMLRITSGLTHEQGYVGGNYGVYVYCNERLITASSRAPEFGFHSGVAGVPHPRMSNARIILEFTGGAARLPWNSSKTGLNFNHEVFKAVREDIHVAVKNATTLSKKLQPDFANSIAPYKEGVINEVKLKSDEHLKPSKLPPIPNKKENSITLIKEANKDLGAEKPWKVGAYEGIIAVETIKKNRGLKQRNRILLIILDSTLEIAFKDYLAHDVAAPLSEAALGNLFKNRIDVHKEVQKTVLTTNADLWKQLSYFYKARCELVHKRFSVTISDEEIETFQQSAEDVLSAMYDLKFPKGS